MNEIIFVAAYLATAFFGLFGFIIMPVLSLWVGLWFAEFCLSCVPLVGPALAKPVHFLRNKVQWLILWPFRKLWGAMSGAAKKSVKAAWRGFIIVLKRLFAAAWRWVKIVAGRAWSRIRGTP